MTRVCIRLMQFVAFTTVFGFTAQVNAARASTEGLKAATKNETRLRAVGNPRAKFLVKATALLEHAEVMVRNAGDHDAKGVKVYILLPDGQHRQMRGASKIAARKESRYLFDTKLAFEKPVTLKVEVTCDNCMR